MILRLSPHLVKNYFTVILEYLYISRGLDADSALKPLRSSTYQQIQHSREQATFALHYQSLETSNITSRYSGCDYLRLSVYDSPI